MAFGDKFQPHSLPDAGGARIIAAGGCVEVGLFPLGLQAAADVVLHSHKQRAGARGHMFCDVKAEGGIATLVGAHQSSVDIHRGLVVHSAKVQQDPPGQFLLAELKVSAVGHAADKISIANAGKPALRAEGDQDLPVEALLLPQAPLHGAAAEVELEFPGPVQIFPCFPLPLGIGMFSARYIHELLPPIG